MIPNKIKRILRNIFFSNVSLSFSQFGEDKILFHLFTYLNIKQPTYLDIGANEPKFISNTYLFYLNNSTGVLIEPNKFLYRKLKKERPKDITLNVGVGFDDTKEATFYQFPDFANGLSTFSKTEADHWANIGMRGLGKIKYEQTFTINLIPINDLLQEYFNNNVNFVSIDVEGLDLQILKSIDFNKCRPNVFCVETLQYDENQKEYKNTSIIDFMISNNYVVYADTHINTIFCDKFLFEK